MADQLVSGIAGEVYKDAKNGIVFIDEKRKYAKTLAEKWECLNDAAKKLDARRQDVMGKKERNKKKRASKELDLWIEKAESHGKDVRDLRTKYDKEMDSARRTFRFFQRSNLSKCLEAKCNDLNKCWEDGGIYTTEIFVEEPQRRITGKLKAPDIEGKSSLFDSFQKALQFLKDTHSKRFGICGTVGVGKTTIMRNLEENEEIAKVFDDVIFLTLSEEWDDEKLQLEIAKRLEINLENIGSTGTIASSITKKLESKRYLFLLDNVGCFFDLDDIGICDSGKGSKVILASRRSDVCRYMNVDDFVKVPPLSADDALKLFEERLGRNIHSECKPIARQIIRECGFLPLLIDRVAINFRKRDDKKAWQSGFNKLRTLEDQNMDEVLTLLRFCFEELRDEKEKFCFLYGALYPEGCSIFIDYLVECWRAEGFIDDTEKSPRDKGEEILQNLIDVSMLESSEEVEHVKMDNIFRKLAVKILTDDINSKSLVEAGKGLKTPPDVKDWIHAPRVSLMGNNFQSLPKKLVCKNLLTLLLQKNNGLTLIPEKFFKSMRNLRVLDLHRTNIRILPKSISFLKNLRALYLNSCENLAALPNEIKALENLEVLDIRGTRISSLPTKIRHLNRLWCLRVSFSNVEVQPMCFHMPFTRMDTKSRKLEACRNAISKLCSLNELVIDVDPEIQWWNELVEAIIQGTRNLGKLTYCTFSIGQYRVSRYNILDCYDSQGCYCLKYANRENVDPVTKDVLAKVDAFELVGHKGAVTLSDFDTSGNSKVKTCLIEGCVEMKTVFDGTKINNTAFRSLEKMYISNVPKLESIWKGHTSGSSQTLNHLTTLALFKCPTLRNIFCSSLIQHLPELCHLEVESCDKVIEIVAEPENIGPNQPVFRSLSTLMLLDLPSLVNVCNDSRVEWLSLEQVDVYECPQLQTFPHSQKEMKINRMKTRFPRGN